MMKKLSEALIWSLDLGINVIIIFGLVLVIQAWIIAPFDVYGSSMCDTLNYIEGECQNGYGEKIILNEATYMMNNPERGDIVVFKTEFDNEKYYIKRVIGLPGETVELRNGKVYITNTEGETFELPENYLNEKNYENTEPRFSDMTVFEVPEGKYFLLGDNRQASTDSRSCFAGHISSDCSENPEMAYVPKENIRGKAWIIWWPLKNAKIIEAPSYINSESLEEK